MITKLKNLCAFALCLLAIAFTGASALADNNTQSVEKAAQEVVQETGVKEQFGKSANGDRLLDDAKAKANKKLNNLADKANSSEDLPDSKKLFLKNLDSE